MNYYKYRLLQTIIVFLVILILSLTLTRNAVAEDKIRFYKTIDTEIIRLTKEYKVDEKLVRAIISCESGKNSKAINPNYNKDGSFWSIDFSLMQINNYFHFTSMEKLGLDYYDEYDSLEYGIILLSTEGTRHWQASRTCWSKLI